MLLIPGFTLNYPCLLLRFDYMHFLHVFRSQGKETWVLFAAINPLVGAAWWWVQPVGPVACMGPAGSPALVEVGWVTSPQGEQSLRPTGHPCDGGRVCGSGVHLASGSCRVKAGREEDSLAAVGRSGKGKGPLSGLKVGALQP